MPNHPNRSKRADNPHRSPAAADVILLRQEVADANGWGITEAQRWCAEQLHTSLRAWQQWEHGDRRMHPAFWALARIKIGDSQ